MPLVNANLPTKSELIGLINQYLVTNGTILATEHNEIETALVNAIYGGQIGDIKEIACTNQYISDNFDMLDPVNPGKGKPNSTTAERYGWAICNGKNGTVDKRGNVSVGYDPVNGYTLAPLGVQGSQGGEKTHTLLVTEMPPHSHSVIPYSGNTGTNNNAHINSSTNGASYDQTGITGGSGGVTVPHNNMQPYIVTLFIQRIAPY